MKIRLEFSSAATDPRLVSVAFWQARKDGNYATDPDRELFTALGANNQDLLLFTWTPSVKAFCVLMLRSYAEGVPLRGDLEGGSRTLAYSLVEVIRRKVEENDVPNWLQSLFLPLLRTRDEKQFLPESLFLRTSNWKQKFFKVELGTDWRSAKLEIRNNNKEVTPKEATQLADEFEAQQEPSDGRTVLSRLSGSMELCFWDAQRLQLLPAESCSLPVPVAAGVTLRIRFDRPAFAYVIWFTAAGRAQPLHPWERFDWKMRSRPSPTVEFILPQSKPTDRITFYPLESRPGIETALVLASEKRPSKSVESEIGTICGRLRRLLPKVLPDSTHVFFLSDTRNAAPARSAFRLGQPSELDNPLQKFIFDAVQHFGGSFPCIFGACFRTKSDA